MTQITIHDCMPMMGDVVSGSVPRPVELPTGWSIDSHVATPEGDVYWPDVAPAWRVLALGNVADVCQVAPRGRDPQGRMCQAIHGHVAELRAALGENGAAICAGGRVVVFNSDGTRAATFDDVEQR